MTHNEPNPTPAQEVAAMTRKHENLALFSGAGCGKTFVLARRFTELVMACNRRAAGDPSLRGINPLSRFVALTFTEKAAQEMKDRVRRMLPALAAGGDADSPSRQRLLGWLEEVDEARISTIHGFCANMLRSHAIEAGVDPNFTVFADELVAAQMRTEAADQAVLAAVEARQERATALLSRLPFSRAVEQVDTLVRLRATVELSSYTSSDDVLARWRLQLAAVQRRQWSAMRADEELGRCEAEVAAAPCGEKLDTFRAELLAAARQLRTDEAAWRDGRYEMLTGIKPGNTGGKEGKPCRDAMRALVGAFGPHACLARQLGAADARAAEQLATLARLAMDADALYTRAKRAAGLLDFDDLMILTHRLLRDHPAVRKSLADGIEQLLIDECQDTDAFQLRLLGYLVGMDLVGDGGEDSRGAGVSPAQTSANGQDAPLWPAQRGRDARATGPMEMPWGRLFVVGDPKQSIYRFRGAQVEVFGGLCDRLGGRHQEQLNESFRTHEAGMSFVNYVFGRAGKGLMAGEMYRPTFAGRTACPEGPSVEILLAEVDGVSEAAETNGKEEEITPERAVAAQAAVMAERIAEMLARRERLVWDKPADDGRGGWRAVEAGDIAILFSRMTVALEYERELAARGIPYYVEAGTGFLRRQEVYDVLNALRAIDNPRNEIAVTGLLRSAMVGLDDNDLLALRGAGETSAPRRATAAMAMIERLHRRKDSLGIADLVRTVLDETGYEVTLLSRPGGERSCGNVRRLMERARSASAMGLSLADFVTQMDQLVLEDSRYEQAAVADESQNIVRLMTIHKAKGLEFPVVFVPDLNKKPEAVKGAILHRNDWGLTYKPADDASDADEADDASSAESGPAATKKDTELPVAHETAREQEAEDQDREDVRRLYVAMTRHEDHLVLVAANWRYKTDGDTAKRRNPGAVFQSDMSFIAKLDDALDMRISTREETAEWDVPYAWPGLGGTVREFAARVRYVRAERMDAARMTVDAASARARLEAARDADEAAAILTGAWPDETDVGIDPRLLAPVRPDIARTELAVTALGDFERCPMLFHWRHELTVPGEFLREEAETSHGASHVASRGAVGGLDPAVAGTVFHRCMERLDVTNPAPAAMTVRQVLADMDLAVDGHVADDLSAQLQEMLTCLRQTDLWDLLQPARCRRMFRELPFVLAAGDATLRGQIDMLIEDTDGRWHVIDYKSDRVSADGLADRAESYRMQMHLYALAAWRHTGTPPARATLYFLRGGLLYPFTVAPAELERTRHQAQALAGQLAHARRWNHYARANDPAACEVCAYRELCR